MNKKILLISHNFSPELTGIGKYNGEMMAWLVENGYQCTVITTFPYYPHWKVQEPYKNVWYKKEIIKYPNGNNLTVYRCPSYIPANPTGKKRMVQDFSFWTSMSWIIMKKMLRREIYDLIITVAPPFHLAFMGLSMRKFIGGKLLYHIQDLQIEAAHGLNMLSNPKLFDRLYSMEYLILRKADFISSISEGMIKKIEAKVKKKVIYFPNWADTSLFFPLPDREGLKAKWGYRPDESIYLYSGGIGEKQGLESIILAAEKLKNKGKLKFIICGSGPYKDKLIEMTEQKGLKNITFMPLQDKEVLNEFLNMADVHLVIQKTKAGDLVMPSKLSTILAVGGASIVTCIPDTTLYDIVSDNQIGFTVQSEDVSLLTDKILEINTRNNCVEQVRNNARTYAINNLNLDNVMNRLMKVVIK